MRVVFAVYFEFNQLWKEYKEFNKRKNKKIQINRINQKERYIYTVHQAYQYINLHNEYFQLLNNMMMGKKEEVMWSELLQYNSMEEKIIIKAYEQLLEKNNEYKNNIKYYIKNEIKKNIIV